MDSEALREAGVVVEETLSRLTVSVPRPRIPPGVIPMGVVLLQVVAGLIFFAIQTGKTEAWWVLAAIVLFFGGMLGVVIWRPAWMGSPNLGELTLTENQLVLPKRAIDLEDIEAVTFVERHGQLPSLGVEITLAEETLTVPMPIPVAGRGPLIRLIRQHIARRRAALAGVAQHEAVPPPALEALRER